MDHRHSDVRLTPKEQALRDLAEARGVLGEHFHQAKAEWRPSVMVKHSMQTHRWVWVAAAGVTGMLLVRIMMPPKQPPKRIKIERDKSTSSATKGGLGALILTAVLGLARQSAIKYGTKYAQTYLHQHLSRHKGDRPSA